MKRAAELEINRSIVQVADCMFMQEIGRLLHKNTIFMHKPEVNKCINNTYYSVKPEECFKINVFWHFTLEKAGR